MGRKCKHQILIAIEDRGISLRWICKCRWWTDSLKQIGEKVGDIWKSLILVLFIVSIFSVSVWAQEIKVEMKVTSGIRDAKQFVNAVNAWKAYRAQVALLAVKRPTFYFWNSATDVKTTDVVISDTLKVVAEYQKATRDDWNGLKAMIYETDKYSIREIHSFDKIIRVNGIKYWGTLDKVQIFFKK